MRNRKSVLLLGATGLVGGECLKLLLREGTYEHITILTRSPLATPVQDARLSHHIVDFNRLDEYRHLMRADHVICALGTTIKQAKTKDNFYRVDFTYAYEIARASSEQGAEHYLLVSSIGADPGSLVYYSQVKGKLEEAVRNIPWRSVSIFRPSLIVGERRVVRFKEEASRRLAGLFAFVIPQKYRPVHASDIATAILRVAIENRAGVRVIESDEITRIARGAS
jgi:uncharacterized protein YbjT (DUF2867 family)